MIETYTFQDVNNKFTLTVNKTFLKQCPEPASKTIVELNRDFAMFTYLHNTEGPAVIRHKDGREEWFVYVNDESRCLTTGLNDDRESEVPELLEKYRKILHDIKFKKRLTDVILSDN